MGGSGKEVFNNVPIDYTRGTQVYTTSTTTRITRQPNLVNQLLTKYEKILDIQNLF